MTPLLRLLTITLLALLAVVGRSWAQETPEKDLRKIAIENDTTRELHQALRERCLDQAEEAGTEVVRELPRCLKKAKREVRKALEFKRQRRSAQGSEQLTQELCRKTGRCPRAAPAP